MKKSSFRVKSFRLATEDGIAIRRFFRKHRILKLAQFLVFLAIIPAFVATANFIAAETPEQALAKNKQPLPAGWTAGVWNHDHYFRWWTISERPILFGLSALTLVIGVLFLWSSLVWLWWKARASQPPPTETNQTNDEAKKKTEDAE